MVGHVLHARTLEVNGAKNPGVSLAWNKYGGAHQAFGVPDNIPERWLSI